MDNEINDQFKHNFYLRGDQIVKQQNLREATEWPFFNHTAAPEGQLIMTPGKLTRA